MRDSFKPSGFYEVTLKLLVMADDPEQAMNAIKLTKRADIMPGASYGWRMLTEADLTRRKLKVVRDGDTTTVEHVPTKTKYG